MPFASEYFIIQIILWNDLKLIAIATGQMYLQLPE